MLVLHWMCWADRGTWSTGEAPCALRAHWVCGSLSGCNCSMLSVTESTWDGVIKHFVQWLQRGGCAAPWEAETRMQEHQALSLSGCCFIWQKWLEGWVLFEVMQQEVERLSLQSPGNFLVRKVMFLYHFSHKKTGEKFILVRIWQKLRQCRRKNRSSIPQKSRENKQSPMMYFQEDFSFKGLILELWSWSQSPLQRALMIS